jgi:hypothetical protein
MKRFLSLLALVVVPALYCSGETAGTQGMMGGSVEKMKSVALAGPTSARDECWLARTDVSANWDRLPRPIKVHYRSYQLYSLNTIQPIHRSDDLHDTFFGYVGAGIRKWKWDDADVWSVGIGARHLSACCGHMFGFGAGYQNFEVRGVKYHGPAVNFEWRTPYSVLTYGYSWDRLKVRYSAAKHFLHKRRDVNVSNLDFRFQIPYLPWTQIMIGKTWYGNKIGRKSFSHHRGLALSHFEFGLRLNLLGCLAFETGRVGGFKTNHYIRAILSFGRPASNEYALTDGVIGNEAFTAYDLRNYGLAPIARTRAE